MLASNMVIMEQCLQKLVCCCEHVRVMMLTFSYLACLQIHNNPKNLKSHPRIVINMTSSPNLRSKFPNTSHHLTVGCRVRDQAVQGLV